jgi:hypothetical protein
MDIPSSSVWFSGFSALAYTSLAVVTFFPVLSVMVLGIKLHPGGMSFKDCPHFSDGAKLRLTQHFSRIEGALGFWKRKATTYVRFHYYCTSWILLSSWLVPLLSVTGYSFEGMRWLILAVSSHVALALSFYRGFNVAENMKAFRHGESEFYDLYRRLLDRPKSFGATEDEQLEEYFRQVEIVRRYIRHAETFNLPSIDDIKEKLRVSESVAE